MTNFDKVKLDDKEKEYLLAVIKPFRDKVISIQKNLSYSIENNNCYIIVKYNDGWDGVSCFALPKFKRDAMYTEMEIDRKYTLEELGI